MWPAPAVCRLEVASGFSFTWLAATLPTWRTKILTLRRPFATMMTSLAIANLTRRSLAYIAHRPSVLAGLVVTHARRKFAGVTCPADVAL